MTTAHETGCERPGATDAASDDDWTRADTLPAPASVPPVRDGMSVFRIEAQGERGVRYPTLEAAMAQDPMDPEAEIRGIGGCLAQAAPDDQRCGWILTPLGEVQQRVERGEVAA